MPRLMYTFFFPDCVRKQTYCDMGVFVTDVCDCRRNALFYTGCRNLCALNPFFHECKCSVD